MASSRPRTEGEAPKRRASARVARALTILSALAVLLLALSPAAALAEETSGYNQEPNKPSTGVSPSKESEAPAKEAAPATTSTAPASEKASTLPFTGFDLRWEIGFGLVLIAAGGSIVAVQRRRRHGER